MEERAKEQSGFHYLPLGKGMATEGGWVWRPRIKEIATFALSGLAAIPAHQCCSATTSWCSAFPRLAEERNAFGKTSMEGVQRLPFSSWAERHCSDGGLFIRGVCWVALCWQSVIVFVVTCNDIPSILDTFLAQFPSAIQAFGEPRVTSAYCLLTLHVFNSTNNLMNCDLKSTCLAILPSFAVPARTQILATDTHYWDPLYNFRAFIIYLFTYFAKQFHHDLFLCVWGNPFCVSTAGTYTGCAKHSSKTISFPMFCVINVEYQLS